VGPQQAVPNPFGITVFGSAVIRVEPDLASIRASVSAVEQKPAEAFTKARRGGRSVQDYLRTLRDAEFGASRIALTRAFRFTNGSNQFVGYEAKISFRIRLSDLDQVDKITEALVEAGANEIESVSFETSRLREVRAEARRSAIRAALDKAKNYCEAADVTLGAVRHIEDVNPMTLRMHEHMPRGGGGGALAETDSDDGALDPSLIEVGAAVYVACALDEA
jgi:uncharacterized protein